MGRTRRVKRPLGASASMRIRSSGIIRSWVRPGGRPTLFWTKTALNLFWCFVDASASVSMGVDSIIRYNRKLGRAETPDHHPFGKNRSKFVLVFCRRERIDKDRSVAGKEAGSAKTPDHPLLDQNRPKFVLVFCRRERIDKDSIVRQLGQKLGPARGRSTLFWTKTAQNLFWCFVDASASISMGSDSTVR